MNETGRLFISKSFINYEFRCKKYGQKGLVVWFTGLSGSGKTTISLEVEKYLFEQGRIVYQLDGDSLRIGLNSDLGFTERDRKENIRRVAEVARLFQDAGVILLISFISPHRDMRAYARSVVPSGSFIEVYVKASLTTCIERDPKGLYQKALSGEIQDYTGISQEYEEPLSPELTLITERMGLNECVQLVIQQIISSLNKEDGDKTL